MKKKIVLLIMCTILTLFLFGCGTTYQDAMYEDSMEDFCNGYFTVVTKWSDNGYRYMIVYANDTKVKYIAIEYGYGFGISPLYNTDGTLQIYNEK